MRTLLRSQYKIDNRLRQAGMASILVTMVLMIVISLIVLGFAQVSRRNQREALDKQLSSQAFYASETGVNDYSKAIKTYLAAHPVPSVSDLAKLKQPSCTHAAGSSVYGSLPSGVLDSSSNVAYTCVLVDAEPTSLQYSSVGSSALIIPINNANTGVPINNLTVSWQTTNTNLAHPADGCPIAPGGIDQFPTSKAWTDSNCGLGILRVDLVPTDTTGGPLTLSGLQAGTMTAFLVPTRPSATGSGTVSYTGTVNNQYGANANQGAVVAAKCDATSGGCSVTISGLSSPNYYMRVNTIYATASLQIQGYTSTAPSTPISLTGAQVLVDSTGKAQDVLRRMQVRIPVNATTGGNTFDSAIQSSLPLCKQFQTAPPNVYTNVAGC